MEVFLKNCFYNNLDQDYEVYPTTLFEVFLNQRVKVLAVDPALKMRLPNGIIVNNFSYIRKRFENLVNQFRSN